MKYVVDELALKRGITVLRLPPYHCELNPIELVWAQVKGEVAPQVARNMGAIMAINWRNIGFILYFYIAPT